MEPLREILFLPKINFNAQFLLKILKIKRHNYFTLMCEKWKKKYDKFDHDMVVRDGKKVEYVW